MQIGMTIPFSSLPLAGQARFKVLDSTSAAEIEALAAQIIPSDGSAGAKEAGVIFFIDTALNSFDKDKQGAYRKGQAEVQLKRKELFPASQSIASLSDSDCHRLVENIETTEFFQMLREHTVMGFLGDPSYGGNKGKVGWKLIGLEDAHSFSPPFGFYDSPEGGEND